MRTVFRIFLIFNIANQVVVDCIVADIMATVKKLQAFSFRFFWQDNGNITGFGFIRISFWDMNEYPAFGIPFALRC